ncbi:MAG: GNAT family N-acetyltransferase [Opitutaceae bacterium]|nr:GNAT family N-acetyltransferase [Opitutaceae bacterium]
MFSELFTQRLIIRQLVPSDAEALYVYRSDPGVLRFQSWEPASVEEVRSFIERLRTLEPLTPGEWFQIGIALRATGELVGDFGLQARADDPRLVEVGITLAPRFQHQGLASEALRALLEFLFTRTETHRVHCSVDPQNHSCLRLLEKIGMRREAHLIESLWLKGAWVDDVIYAMLRREWEANQTSKP